MSRTEETASVQLHQAWLASSGSALASSQSVANLPDGKIAENLSIAMS